MFGWDMKELQALSIQVDTKEFNCVTKMIGPVLKNLSKQDKRYDIGRKYINRRRVRVQKYYLKTA